MPGVAADAPLAAAEDEVASPQFIGIDFSSAPSRRKPIVIARCTGRWSLDGDGNGDAGGGGDGGGLDVAAIERIESLAAFDDWLGHRPEGGWVAGCDLPFGLPRAFVAAQGWLGEDGRGALDWPTMIDRVAALTRAELVDRCRAYCAGRPAGARLAHRVTDGPAGASSSMKWVNPPVVLMFHAGATRLAAAGVDLPGLRPGDRRRVALEAYPGMLARELIGRRSYKNDDRRRDDAGRRAARADLVAGLAAGRHRLGIALRLEPALAAGIVAEHSADTLDALICAVQAAWGWHRRDQGYGLAASTDPLEGWIVTAPELTEAPARVPDSAGRGRQARLAR